MYLSIYVLSIYVSIYPTRYLSNYLYYVYTSIQYLSINLQTFPLFFLLCLPFLFLSLSGMSLSIYLLCLPIYLSIDLFISILPLPSTLSLSLYTIQILRHKYKYCRNYFSGRARISKSA